MMLAFEVEYLLGRAVATNREIRSEVEWPPHPQRLFAALVASYKELGFGDEERHALEWLETQPAPGISHSDWSQRTKCPVYVPVNDESTPNKPPKNIENALKALPGERTRQERFFPTVVPHSPLLYFLWDKTDPRQAEQHRPALERLAAGVGYLGHSSSPVRVSIVDDPGEPTLIPTNAQSRSIDERLRTVSSGRLKLLEEVYDQSQKFSRRIEAPDVPRTAYVERLTSDVPRPVFGGASDWFVFERVEGNVLPLNSSLALTGSVRRALCQKSEDSVAALLCGHEESDGTPSTQPHVAYIPLAHVGHKHTDGQIHGFAVVLPRDLDWSDRMAILQGIGQLRKVWNNDANERHRAFDWRVELATAENRKKTLLPHTWTKKSRCWATVTPVVFGHFLHRLDDSRASRIVSESCEAIGLPKPKFVRISTTSLHEGVPVSAAFPSLSTRGKPVWTTFQNRRHRIPRKLPDGSAVRMRYHVAVEFEEDVFGPVILGAGRYFGMGLCRPLFA